MGIFEYHYRFEVDNEILSNYCSYITRKRSRLDLKFIFDTRTNFIVKRKFDEGGGGAHEMIIDSQCYAFCESDIHDWENCSESTLTYFLKFSMICHRLKEYWMSNEEIQEFISKAFAFAKQREADPKYGMVPISVDINICTVQQEGELINATMDRAIRSQYLYPLHLCPVNCMSLYYEHVEYFRLISFLWYKLLTARVEDVDKASSLVEECPICLRSHTVGVQFFFLECGHVFHSHCIVRWLQDKSPCSMCRQQARKEWNKNGTLI